MRRITSNFPTFLAVYVLLYAAFGVQSPFLPALLRERGLHAEDIGIVMAASTAIRFWPVQRSGMPLIASECMRSRCAPAHSPLPWPAWDT